MPNYNYPSDWAVLSIKELTAEFLNGGTPSTHIKELWGENIPWITGADAEQKVTTISRKSITELGVKQSSTNVVPKNNILLVTRTGVGKVSISGVDVAISQDLTGLIPKSDLVDIEYLYYQLVQLSPALIGLTQGSIIQGVQREEVEALTIPVPALSEQRKIAEILSTLDEAIAQTEALIRKQERVKQGLMSDLLTRGLDENGKVRKSSDFAQSSLGRFPQHWAITTLGEILSKNGGVIQTGPFGSQLHSYEYVQDGVPVIMPQDITDNGEISVQNIARIMPKKAQELGRHIVQENDVVFARRGDLSRCSAIQTREIGWLCGTGCMLARFPKGIVDGKWLAAIYRHDIGQRQIQARAVGSTMVNLNSTLLRDLTVPMPDFKEQQAIMQILDAQENLLEQEIAGLGKLQSLKHGLMQDLLSGAVRVGQG